MQNKGCLEAVLAAWDTHRVSKVGRGHHPRRHFGVMAGDDGLRRRNSFGAMRIEAAFEKAGILFIAGNEIAGIGVRLGKKKRR